MKKILTTIFALLALGMAATACGPRSHNHSAPPNNSPKGDCALQLATLNACAQVSWDKGPTDKETSVMQLRLLGPISDKQPVTPVDSPVIPHVKLWMPDMDHGSNVPAKVEKVAPGVYQVSDLVFTMDGLWEVRIQILEGDKVID
ncbi:MAG: FixH family protein, partial [Bdellovibrionales bacterium]